jgi:hypothetical protein
MKQFIQAVGGMKNSVIYTDDEWISESECIDLATKGRGAVARSTTLKT